MKTYALDETFSLGETSYKSKTYAVTEEKIEGFTDGLEALKQAIYKLLRTEQFEHPIYSWYYGIEMKKLIGKDRAYVRSELKRMIEDALLRDDRIVSVDSFEFSFDGDCCMCSFSVSSIYGEFETGTEVAV